MGGKIDDGIVLDRHAFRLQHMLHLVGVAKVVFAAQHAVAVDHAVRGNGWVDRVAIIHGPTHQAGGLAAAQVACNSTVAGGTAFGNEPHDGVNVLVKTGIGHLVGQR